MFKSSLSSLEYQTSMTILLKTFPVFHQPYNILLMFFSIEFSQIYIFKLVKFFLVVFPFSLCLESLSLLDSHIYMYTQAHTHTHTHIYIYLYFMPAHFIIILKFKCLIHLKEKVHHQENKTIVRVILIILAVIFLVWFFKS